MIKSVLSDNPQRCTGCGGCAQVCQKNAVTFIRENGFLYPIIDDELCVSCDLCRKNCPIENVVESKNSLESIHAYSARSKDDTILQYSSSGGIFSELAKEVLRRGGVVYGVAMRENKAMHSRVTSEKNLAFLMGSKYIQSEPMECFEQIGIDLKAGREVLFSGTPCQIAAVKKRFPKAGHLILIDFICHGISSPEVYQKYINFIEKKYGKRVEKVNFRNKEYGWNQSAIEMVFTDGSRICEKWSENLYMQTFLGNISIRESCFNCMYNRLPRVSDMTLADFWKIENFCEDYNDDRGCSALVINSNKGNALFGAVAQSIQTRHSSVEEIKVGNPFIDGHCKPGKRRKEFLKNMQNLEIDEAMRRSLRPTFGEIVQSVVYNKLLKPVYNMFSLKHK